MTCVALSPDGGSLLVGRFIGKQKGPVGRLECWRVEGQKPIQSWPTDSEAVLSARFDPTGERAVMITSGSNIHIHTLQDGLLVRSFQAATVNTLALAPSGRTLVTGGEDYVVRLRAVQDEVAILGGGSNVAFSRDGRRVLAQSATQVQNPLTGEAVGSDFIPLLRQSETRIALSTDGRWVTNGAAVFDTSFNGQGRKKWELDSNPLSAALGVAFSPDSRLIATTGRGSGLSLYEVDPPRLVAQLRKSPKSGPGFPTTVKGTWPSCVRFSPDGNTLAVGFGSDDYAWRPGEVQLWDVRTQKLVAVLDQHYFSVWDLAFSPDGKLLAGACGIYKPGTRAGEVKVWDVASRREVTTLSGYTACVWSVSFSPDGTRLATASGDNRTTKASETARVRVWDLPSGQEVVSIAYDSSVYGVAYSPDGQRMGVVGLGIGQIWGPP